MSAVRIGDRATLVLTDKEWDDMNSHGALRCGNDCVVLTVPNDATFEQRQIMAARAAQIRHGLSPAPPQN